MNATPTFLIMQVQVEQAQVPARLLVRRRPFLVLHKVPCFKEEVDGELLHSAGLLWRRKEGHQCQQLRAHGKQGQHRQ